MTTDPEVYFTDGCGRCSLFGTPECKVHLWTDELLLIREIALESGLEEEAKWGSPCYTLNGKNIIMIGAFKEYCCLSFFKGSLLEDPEHLLVSQGSEHQIGRIFKVTDLKQIKDHGDAIQNLIQQAIIVEESGVKVERPAIPEEVPEELIQKMEQDPGFRNAFEALTPGRQRGYIIYFGQAKQSATRIKRIEKYEEQILNGVGMHDKYSCKPK